MISEATARELIDTQFPAWRDLPLRPVTGGTVNAVFRIGDDLAARFPLGDGEDLEAEAAAARLLGEHTRVPVPLPVAIGSPGAGYPRQWSVQTWVPGSLADADAAGSGHFARDLAALIRDVRAIPASGHFDGRGRGGVLKNHDKWVRDCLPHYADRVRLTAYWERVFELPRESTPDVMSHRDLIPGNVLVRDGRLAGVLDVGGMRPSDPALDLVAAWHLLDAGPREIFRAEVGGTASEWERGKGWAFEQAIGLVWYYAQTNPFMSRTGRRTLDRLLEDDAG